MIKKWLEIVFDHHISLQERLFRVTTGICMVALFFILPMGRNPGNFIILAASLAAISLIVKFSIRKECINAGATGIVVLLLLLFPFSFFTAGGFYSGVPEWGGHLLHLYQPHPGGPPQGGVFPAGGGGDHRLLLPSLPGTGLGGPAHPGPFLL